MGTRIAALSNPCRTWLSGQAGRALWPLLVTLLLAAALLVRLAVAGRELLDPQGGNAEPGEVATQQGLAQAHVDLVAIQEMRLFDAETGDAALMLASTPAAPAPVLQGSMRLEGVALSGVPEQSVAFVRSGGRQQAFRVGDTLADGAMRLSVVARDHVILDRRGERVRLDLHASGEQAAASEPAATGLLSGLAQGLPSINQGNLAEALQAVDEAMGLASLAEVIEVRPAQQNGRLIGYQLSPGVRLKEFVQLGLRTGDIVTAVNGVPLDDMAALQSLGGLMNGATEVSFSLLREGQVQNLRISLQALAENGIRSTDNINNMERP